VHALSNLQVQRALACHEGVHTINMLSLTT